MTTKALRERIQRERNITLDKTRRSRVMPAHTDKSRTPLMHYFEQVYHVSIQSLIMQGNIQEVSVRLNVHKSTISKWRLRLKLR